MPTITQDLILNRDKSVLVESGRSQIISLLGDLWLALKAYATDAVRFSMAATYNATEQLIDQTIDAGYEVFETLDNGSTRGISKAPNRPVPPTS